MTTINGVDFDDVVTAAVEAAKVTAIGEWDKIQDVVELIADSMLKDLEYVAKKKLKNEFDEYDAKIFLEDQKMVARTRLRAVAIITLQSAERILNAINDVFKEAAESALGWDIF